MALQTFNVEQGTAEWLACRAGIVTASAVAVTLRAADKKTREDYIFHLIGERWTGQPGKSFVTVDTIRGHDDEPEAVALYAEYSDIVVEHTGFITNHEDLFDGEPVGYSPDALAGEGLAEMKSRLPKIQARLLYENAVPKSVMPQLQGGLWVTKRPWIDYVSFCRGMPLFVKRVVPDLVFFEEMQRSVGQFYRDLRDTMDVIRSNTGA